MEDAVKMPELRGSIVAEAGASVEATMLMNAQRLRAKTVLSERLTQGTREGNVKNEDCSQWLIENKGAKKVIPMSL